MSRVLARLLGAAVLVSLAASGSAEEPEWPDDESGLDVRTVNEGELRFLDRSPGRLVHHHHNHMDILPSSLADGWVNLNQCHAHLDPVPDTQIVYHPDRIRGLRIVSVSGIGAARVEGHSVQMKDIRRGAKICINAETHALTANGEGRYLLTNGPFMRRFLDGFYPMHVTMEIRFPDDCLAFRSVEPEPEPGFRLTRERGAVHIDALFEGRLTTAIEFNRLAAPGSGPGGC